MQALINVNKTHVILMCLLKEAESTARSTHIQLDKPHGGSELQDDELGVAGDENALVIEANNARPGKNDKINIVEHCMATLSCSLISAFNFHCLIYDCHFLDMLPLLVTSFF
mgnify:CR=1 FL=1